MEREEHDQYCYVCEKPLLESDDISCVADGGDDHECHASCVDEDGYAIWPAFQPEQR